MSVLLFQTHPECETKTRNINYLVTKCKSQGCKFPIGRAEEDV